MAREPFRYAGEGPESGMSALTAWALCIGTIFVVCWALQLVVWVVSSFSS